MKILFWAAALTAIASPALAQPMLQSSPCESDGATDCYCVSNRTSNTIQWWDGQWASKETSPGNTECVKSAHSPAIEIWDLSTKEKLIKVDTTKDQGCTVVLGKNSIIQKPGLTRPKCAQLKCG